MNPLYQTLYRRFFGPLAILALTAVPALAADPVFPTASRIGLVPPAGFVASTKFTGFENPQANAAILLAAIPPDTYPDLEKFITDEALKSRGIKVAMREAIALKDGKGILVSGPKEADGVKRYEAVFIANLAGAAALISVQMLETSRGILTDAVIRDMLKTVAVRLQIPESEQLAVLPYKIGDLAHYDGHVCLCYHPGNAETADWFSFGSEPPSKRKLYYRDDFRKVVRPPLVKS